MIHIKNYKTDQIEKNDISVCRPSPLGNPYSFQPSRHAKLMVATRKEAIESYALYLDKMVAQRDPIFCDELNRILIRHLRGEDVSLVCCCSPLDCHGRIIREWCEKQKYCFNWFSNMAILKEPIVYQGIEYFSSENLYQAGKLAKSNLEGRKRIASLPPHQSKTQIRFVAQPYASSTKKLQVMEHVLRLKFAQEEWKAKLLAAPSPIVEYNNWGDTFFGVDIRTMQGKNHLGAILTKIKEDLS